MRRRRSGRLSKSSGVAAVIVLLAAGLYSLSRGGKQSILQPPAAGERGREPLSLASASAPGERVAARVAAVADGDTLTLADGRQVRYLGLDTPEGGEPWAEAARQANQALVGGAAVELWLAVEPPLDRYGRLLAMVYAPSAPATGGESRSAASGTTCVNLELLRRGLAWVYLSRTDSVPGEVLAALLAAQGEALSERRGLWRERLEDARALREKLVSTRLRIHRRSCPEVRSLTPRPVESLEDEFRQGKSPCRECRPLAR